MKAKIIPRLTVILGMILLIIGFIIPYESLENIIGKEPNLVGIVSVFIIPSLGLIGSIVSLYKKQWLLFLLNVFLIFIF